MKEKRNEWRWEDSYKSVTGVSNFFPAKACNDFLFRKHGLALIVSRIGAAD